MRQIDHVDFGETGHQLNQGNHSGPLGGDVSRVNNGQSEIGCPDCSMMGNITGDKDVGDIGRNSDE